MRRAGFGLVHLAGNDSDFYTSYNLPKSVLLGLRPEDDPMSRLPEFMSGQVLHAYHGLVESKMVRRRMRIAL